MMSYYANKLLASRRKNPPSSRQAPLDSKGPRQVSKAEKEEKKLEDSYKTFLDVCESVSNKSDRNPQRSNRLVHAGGMSHCRRLLERLARAQGERLVTPVDERRDLPCQNRQA